MHGHPYWYDGDGWPPWWMALVMVLYWVGLMVLGVVLARWALRPGRQPAPGDPQYQGGPPRRGPDPERLLAERFARGEIDEAEYRSRLAVLRGESGDRPRQSG
jgi:putative membrane protein